MLTRIETLCRVAGIALVFNGPVAHGNVDEAHEWRSLNSSEAELLRELTALGYAGSRELHDQIPFTRASPGCDCGCGSISLIVDRDRVTASAVEGNPVPGEATVIGMDGNEAGGLILFHADGYLSSLEVYSHGDPLALPDVSHIRPLVVHRSNSRSRHR